MSQPTYHLAQVNIARMLAPLYDPGMAEFVAGLDEINQLADKSPGVSSQKTGEWPTSTSSVCLS